MTCYLGQMLCFTMGYMLICVVCVSAVVLEKFDFSRPPLYQDPRGAARCLWLHEANSRRLRTVPNGPEREKARRDVAADIERYVEVPVQAKAKCVAD